MGAMRDPYSVLGLTRHASAEDIKRAYRRLARERHPDSDRDNPRAEDDFKHLAAAYRLLNDPAMRNRFDRGEVDAEGNPTHVQRGRARHPFGSAFGDAFRRKNPSGEKRTIKVDGANVTYGLKISFKEAALGTEKQVGMANGKRLNVRVPAGTEHEQTLRLRGQGMPGIGEGKDGDALVTVEVEPDPQFKQTGEDIHADVPVSLPEAVLGGKVPVETIHGTVMATVPENSNTGTLLRLKGKGIKKPGGRTGDHYAILKVVLPRGDNASLKKFVEGWAKTNAYDPRPSLRKDPVKKPQKAD